MSEELARRAVACEGWRWMPGMRAIDSDGQAVRVVQASGAAVLEDVGGAAYPMLSTPPDLDDPATLGCLLALVREAWELPVAVWYPKVGGCCVGVGRMPTGSGHIWTRVDLAKALVAALEAAP